MGTIVRRGTRDNPRFYIQYRELDGHLAMRAAKGAETKEHARTILAAAERNVTNGKPGMVDGMVEQPPPRPAPPVLVWPLMATWLETLTNRTAKDDRGRVLRHVQPFFENVTVADAQEQKTIMAWLDNRRAEQKRLAAQAQRASAAATAAGKPEGSTRQLSEATIRHAMNCLSRFFGWAIVRGHAKVNPIRMLPTSERPQGTPKAAGRPWLEDDALVTVLFNKLPEPLNLMFYLGNRSALRNGEIAGLRMRGMDEIAQGRIVARNSYDGPLKESTPRHPKPSKLVPAPVDIVAVLGPWLARRKREGAGPDDSVFEAPVSLNNPRKGTWKGYRKENIDDIWESVASSVGVEMTWYEATRHSFASRSLKNGASAGAVADAMGHSSSVVTERYYRHWIRKDFPAELRLGLPSPVTAVGGGEKR